MRLAAALVAVFALLATALVAAPAHAASGTVTGVVKGRYVGGAAAPIADVQVLFDKLRADGYSHDNAVHRVYTNSAGRYTATGVADGRYRVRFYSADYNTTGGLGYEYYNNKWSPYGTSYVTVSGGTVTLREVLLEQPGWITGTVRDTAGKPVPGARISVQDTPTSGGYGVQADSQGRYSTRLHPDTKNTIPGSYTITPSGEGWEIDQPVYDSPSATVAVAANKEVKRDFVLTRQKTVTFTVLDTNGAPLVGAPVGIWYREPTTGRFEPIRSGPHETDASGRYRFVQGWDVKLKIGLPQGYEGTGHPEYWDGPDGQGAYAYSQAAVLDWKPAVIARAYTIRLGAAPVVKPGTVRVSGTAKVGRTLTANAGAWTPSGVALSYQWTRNGADIPGATSRSLKVTPALAKTAISVRVTGRLAGAPAVDAASPAQVTVKVGSLKTAKPRITGKAKVGKRLKVKPGTWGPKPVKLKFQWLRGGKAIKGATAKAYKVKKKDRGKKLKVRVTATKAGYATVSKVSRATIKVKR